MDFGSLDTWATAQGLAAALAVGVLIGVERGWRDRDLADFAATKSSGSTSPGR